MVSPPCIKHHRDSRRDPMASQFALHRIGVPRTLCRCCILGYAFALDPVVSRYADLSGQFAGRCGPCFERA